MATLSRLVLTFLLNAAWQVPPVALAAAAITRLLHRAPATYRHALWVMALLLALLLPLASLPGSEKLSRALAETTTPSESEIPPPHTVLPPGLAKSSFDPLSARIPADHLALNPFRHRRWVIAISPLWADVLLSVYLLSLLCYLIRLACAWARTRQLRRSARPQSFSPDARALVAKCQAAVGLRNVTVLASREMAGPAAVGVFRPVIILPESLLAGPCAQEFASALSHEMAHVRRGDYLQNLIYEFAFLPLAFHPAAWLLKRRINEIRELACDEAAARGVSGPAAYARSLVSLAHSMAPFGPHSRARYTLGVFDANILEERIMRLLDKRPQISSRRARCLLGGAVLAMILTALSVGAFSLAAVQDSESATPATISKGFSGRWELDKSQSDLPSPSPDNLVETINLHGSQLKVTTTSKDWNWSKPIAVTLFALLIPEFSTTTDGHETVHPFGLGQIRSKTHWKDGNLVTDWTLERNGQVAITGRWVRSISDDGKRQTVDITGHDPVHNLNGQARVVFVKRGDDEDAFLGTWHAEFQGKQFLTLVLKKGRERVTGTLSPIAVNFDADGNLSEAAAGTGDGWEIVEANFLNGALDLKCKEAGTGEIDEFTMRPVGDGKAEFTMLGMPPSPG